ncbi:MAG: aspartate/glutamate racemase family protein [Clostridia bacterium]|nr:aspartate/glutamate racemase family protein [Clostridia bacterium]
MIKVGLLVPSTNLTVEYELEYLYYKNILKHDKINCYVAKLDYSTSYKQNKIEFLKEISLDSTKKVKQLEYLGVNYIASFCTSASVVSDVKMINNPMDAILEEAKKKNIKKCMLVTPYDAILGRKIKEALEENNIMVSKAINFNLLDTKEYFEFGRYKLENHITDNYIKEYEDIIISCTNLPTLHIIENIENAFGTNVLSSNYCVFNKIISLNNKE